LILSAEPVDKNKGKGFLKKAKSKSNVCSTKNNMLSVFNPSFDRALVEESHR
jgi:hypothetical protein